MSKLDSLRLRQCRNILGTGDGGYTQRTIELCEPKGSPEKCEVAFAQGISAKQQDGVLSHDDLFCRMCGVIPGDIDDVTVRKVKFNIEYIVDKSLGGKEELSNLLSGRFVRPAIRVRKTSHLRSRPGFGSCLKFDERAKMSNSPF